jgi:hypothetical protein
VSLHKFSHHEACDNCGSKDNVGVWTDGHKYCFGCRWYLSHKGQNIKDLKQQLKQQEKQTNVSISLPDDFTTTLPPEALTWLRKYDITDKEIYDNRIGWSGKYGVVFPIFDIYGNLVCFQSRFGFEPSGRKTIFSSGNFLYNDTIIGAESSCVVCSEDFLSTIKIGRVAKACCLFGSNIDIGKIRRLSDRFSELVIWLDKDKFQYAIKARFRASPYFNKVAVIHSEKDPKKYGTDEIKCFIENAI